MKKILTIVVAAITLTAMSVCVGCTGSNEGNAEGNDSTAVEQQDGAKTASPQVDKDRFTLTLPEGWIDNRADNEYLADCRKPQEDDKSSFHYDLEINANTAKSMSTAEKAVSHMTEKGSLKAGEDMVIGDKTFKVVNHGSDPNHCWLYTDLPQGDGVLQVEVFIGNVNDPEVQQLLQSITFK